MKKITQILQCLSIDKHKGFSLTIGNFDGVHLGHQKLLRRFVQESKKRELYPLVLTFYPHPYVFIHKKNEHVLLPREQKNECLENLFDLKVIELDFDTEMQKTSGEEFLVNISKSITDLKLLFVGHDFSLGAKREVDFYKAKTILSSIEFIQDTSLCVEENLVSSSAIRRYLEAGNILMANKMLGHPFCIKSTVQKGNQVGGKIGFHTANLHFSKHQFIPKLGVYRGVVKVQGEIKAAAINIGKRPTVTDDDSPLVEVHIFDFDGDLYEKSLEVFFLEYIREEKKFDSKKELSAQIQKDIDQIKSSTSLYKMALIGKNISHSKSKEVYQSILPQTYIDYDLLDYSSEAELETIKNAIQKYHGVSVTAPYKRAMFNLCEQVDESVRFLEAVNALKVVKGELLGTNTDYLASNELIDQYKVREASHVLVLGDGSMSRVIVELLKRKGIEHDVLSRKQGNLKGFETGITNGSIVINTCSREYRLPKIKQKVIVWDLNYGMDEHQTMYDNSNVFYINGYELLISQAKYALQFFSK